jgi:hypothetical protein
MMELRDYSFLCSLCGLFDVFCLNSDFGGGAQLGYFERRARALDNACGQHRLLMSLMQQRDCAGVLC